MGLFFSCCRRHKDSKDREPLLPKDRVNAAANEYLPSQTQLEKLADVVAALKTGKLPSQDQLNRVIQSLLRSTSPNQSYGTLSEQGKQVVSDLRTLLETLLQLGLEKNDDNELQELIYQVSKIPAVPVHADVIVNANESSSLDVQDVVGQIPSREEAQSDVRTIIHSIRQLSTILLTSSTFRIILSDLFKVAREIVADTAADVGRIAATVEASADKVEEALRPEGATLEDVKINSEVARDEVVNDVSAVSEETQTRWNHLSTESPERTKEAVVGRLQQAIAQAHSNPDYQVALRSLLYLFQDYASRLSDISASLADAKAPTITPILWTDPHLSQALTHLATLISRLASGRSVDSWVNCLQAVIMDIGKLPSGLTAENDELHELRSFFSDLSSWLDQALDSPQYATSSVGQHNAEALYDRAHHLINEASRSDRPWAQHIRDLIHETDLLLNGISNDRTANRFIGAVSALSTSLSNYTYKLVRQAPGQLEESKRRLRNQLQRDVLQWLLPRLLRALHVIPVPRVEFRSNSLDAAIDTLYLTPSSAQLSLVPDHIHVQNWTELHIDMSEVRPEAEAIIPAVEYNGMQTHTKLRVSVQGIRVSARNVAYYACYRLFGSNKWLSWLGYEDEGLASVDVGSRGAKDEGLNFEFELQFPPDDANKINTSGQPLFFVCDVRVDVPGLQLSLDRSKHWILNKLFLQPLSAPVGRLATAWVLQNQAHALLESLADVGGKVVRGAQRSALDSRRELDTGDYINAVWRVLTGPSDESAEESEYHDENEETPLVETHTKTTAKGIVRTNLTFAAEAVDGSDAPEPVEESTLAIGVGEQILPGKGGPHDGHGEEERYGPRELARDALDQIQSRVDGAIGAEEAAIERGTGLRAEVQDAVRRERQSEREEVVDDGWRSDAFNF